jgi:hypothetical protein
MVKTYGNSALLREKVPEKKQTRKYFHTASKTHSEAKANTVLFAFPNTTAWYFSVLVVGINGFAWKIDTVDKIDIEIRERLLESSYRCAHINLSHIETVRILIQIETPSSKTGILQPTTL